MIPDTRIPFRLSAAAETLLALADAANAHTPIETSALLGAGEEIVPHTPTMRGTDLDRRAVVVRRGTHAVAEHRGGVGVYLDVSPSGLTAHERKLLEGAEQLGADCS